MRDELVLRLTAAVMSGGRFETFGLDAGDRARPGREFKPGELRLLEDDRLRPARSNVGVAAFSSMVSDMLDTVQGQTWLKFE